MERNWTRVNGWTGTGLGSMDGQELEQGGGEGGPRVQVVLSDHAGTQALERSMSNRVGDLKQT